MRNIVFYSLSMFLKILYTNIPVEDAINSIKQLVWQYQNVIPDAELVVELFGVILKNSLMLFDREYFQKIFRRHYGHQRCANPRKHLKGNTGKSVKTMMMVLELLRQIKMNLNFGQMNLICLEKQLP